MKLAFIAILLAVSIVPAFSQSLITFDVDTTQFAPGEIVELTGSVQEEMQGQPVAIEIKDAKGSVILIRTVTSDSDGNFILKFKVPNSVEAGELDIITNIELDGQTFSESMSVETVAEPVVDVEPVVESMAESRPACGTGTIEENGICVVDTSKTEKVVTKEKSSKGGGCLIATATYGSEMASEVQQLRELRDNTLLQTESGTAFMGMFNDIYYSFSPVIADYERENPIFKEIVKVAITPLINSLSILNYVDMDSESEVLGYGISLILLNLGMYLGVPAVVIVGIMKIK
jgi:hypothetical protein